MKILNEAKEALPISFLTDFLSKGWEDVGMLKEQLKAIKADFKGTGKVYDVLGEFSDKYLETLKKIQEILENHNDLN